MQFRQKKARRSFEAGLIFIRYDLRLSGGLFRLGLAQCHIHEALPVAK